ncbi:unnamed protein product [Aphanomyces euteiches]|uniref:Uncharacterized protein n=1 Tax=Aphanomyces euteiches TaxID=100861 RepID=A0A6G0WJ25_9STRA|nr:hypothetical protein Ae201684_014727 [Aphanomyces euteiches]KAH9078901.1 hypothetical protein Ae201684P_019964 [Aphanomyces euteiches]KAH9157979.1 hypothetical protein AeRB84_000217 [Aphanomyces euteiches]
MNSFAILQELENFFVEEDHHGNKFLSLQIRVPLGRESSHQRQQWDAPPRHHDHHNNHRGPSMHPNRGGGCGNFQRDIRRGPSQHPNRRGPSMHPNNRGPSMHPSKRGPSMHPSKRGPSMHPNRGQSRHPGHRDKSMAPNRPNGMNPRARSRSHYGPRDDNSYNAHSKSSNDVKAEPKSSDSTWR